ncbi:MAG: metallophosphoesterase [Lachnospiraceae bacterium]|nr:metallophosphoesterase [Lachnospiraceae bacterium]
MGKLHWLHLSDIHLNKKDVDSRRMRNNLLDYVRKLDVQIDYIFLTGDLRYAPSGNFSTDTVEYINKLLNAANLTVDRLFVVPGNHDIRRDADGREDAILECIKNYSPKVGSMPLDKMLDIKSGHTEFHNMISMIYHDKPDRISLYDNVERPHFVVETKDFNIICIDTTITYTAQRSSDLIIGAEWLMDLFEKLNQDKPSIILTHFSFDYLNRNEQMQVLQLMKDFHVQLWLSGHEHMSFLRKQCDYFYEFQCGNLMHEEGCEAGEYTKSVFLIGTYDSERHTGIIEAHEWDSVNGWFKMQNIGPHKEDFYSYELQNDRTMINQIASVARQDKKKAISEEIISPTNDDKLLMETTGGVKVASMDDVEQFPNELHSGYLFTNNDDTPVAQVDVYEYNIYGTKYYVIQNDGFSFTYFNLGPANNVSFGYDLSKYTDVSDRLFWFKSISEILDASKITVRIVSSGDVIHLLLPAGNDFEQVRIDTLRWQETMKRIAKIEKYYGVKFSLPKMADSDIYAAINILSDSIDGLSVRRLPVVKMKSRGFLNKFRLKNEVWYGDGTGLMSLTLFGYTFKPSAEYILPGEFSWNRKEHGWESDKENGGVSVRIEFEIDNDISKDIKLIEMIPVSELDNLVDLEEITIFRGEHADFLADYMDLVHKIQEIFRQYQMYQKSLEEWVHYDLDEEHHLVKKYSGAVIDKITVNKMTKTILYEGITLIKKADAIIQTLGLQNSLEFLNNAIFDFPGLQFMILVSSYENMGHWAVNIENGECFYNLPEMCATLKTLKGEEGSSELLNALMELNDELLEQNIDVSHIDHYSMLRNYIFAVADVYMKFFDVIQKKMEDKVAEVDLFLKNHPKSIIRKGEFKGYVFYQTDNNLNSVDAFDPSSDAMAEFFIFKKEAIRNHKRAAEGIQNPETFR